MYMKDKELNYGKRIAVLEKIGCRLFKTNNFSEVLCFSMRYKGVQAKEELEGLVKLQFEEKMMKAPVKMSARKMVKLKCSFGGTWSQLNKLRGAL